jgi:hypothetical protein
MLSNVEFAFVNHTPLEIAKEMEDFAMFSIDIGAYIDEETKQLAFPSMIGKLLWKVKKTSKANKAILAKQDAAKREIKRQKNLAIYIERGYAFDKRSKDMPNDCGDEIAVVADEWDTFFNS